MSLRIVAASFALCLAASAPGLAAPPGAAADTAGAAQASLAQAAPRAEPDRVVNDPTIYNTGPTGQVNLAQVNETTSLKHHSMAIDGKLVRFTAGAGHLVVNGADGKPEAAFFYTAYTMDGAAKNTRPVTFLWNGGPGSASIWLHMGSWAPKRLKSDAPNIINPAQQPDSFPLVDNEITLLKQSDLVFVDPPGTGYSAAIAPHTNRDWWGVDADGVVVADFITRYINQYNRQSSPKYLYGESYGGIRTPIVAKLLERQGTSLYAPDPTGKPPVVLTGVILNSPILDYASNCEMEEAVSCGGYLPSYAMMANFFHKSPARGSQTIEQYLAGLRQFTSVRYAPVEAMTPGARKKFLDTQKGWALLNDLVARAALDTLTWYKSFKQLPGDYRNELMPGYELGRYDGRMKVPAGNSYAPDDYINLAFLNQFKQLMPYYVNYRSASTYEPLGNAIFYWNWNHNGTTDPNSLGDIQIALTYDPGLKWLVMHGYEDNATPGYQTELDLIGVDLYDRVPVKWFEGGHMTYNTEASRPALEAVISDFYAAPPFGSDAAEIAQQAAN
ncbi:S10 family serine carboxypeptidase-like protein [Inquilinus limosus]|uniref:S10 family serine carboxypeptidase-like protein n=1 Tax=Inquilinus limosus TaxID=171674 RepID=UPI000B48E1EF|nr:peptidase [Inquilinus limosus]